MGKVRNARLEPPIPTPKLQSAADHQGKGVWEHVRVGIDDGMFERLLEVSRERTTALTDRQGR